MADNTDLSETDVTEGYFYSRLLQWRRTSFKELENVDRKILDSQPCVQEKTFVPVDDANQLWSIVCGANHTDKTPVVMVHGMGGGVGLWALNLEALSHSRRVYAFDLLGFGRSSRPVFSSEAQEAEDMFVESIENYRRAMGVERFILVGHSLGGYLGAAYSLRHPQRVKHLVLVDPWGMPRRPAQPTKPLPLLFRLILSVVKLGYPMSVVRMLGPWGPSLVKRYRPRLAATFGSHLGDDSLLHDYIYHCNAQDPSGEIGFKNISDGFGWAKHPMIERMSGLDPTIPVTFVYGADSWVDRRTGLGFQKTHTGQVDVKVIEGAGHHVYADRFDDFNRVVEAICQGVDSGSSQQSTDLHDRLQDVSVLSSVHTPESEDPKFRLSRLDHPKENTQTVITSDCDNDVE